MPVMPVINREMRASARHSFTYYLRTLGAAALLLTSLFFGLNHGFEPNLGGGLFAALHLTLFIAIWILVPLLTADCLSRERREGTLGLLFLTRLQASDIVIAKGLAHGLRAMTLWLAVLPVATIPFLLGGLSWSEAILSVMINLSAMCWALAAGLLASAWSKRWLQALVRAAILAILFLMTMSTVIGKLLLVTLSPATPGRGIYIHGQPAFAAGLGFISTIALAQPMYIQFSSRSIMPTTMAAAPTSQLFWVIGQAAILSLLVLVLCIVLAGSKIRRSWQEEPPSKAQLWFQAKFCTPMFWLSFFRAWMRRKLERNPIGWLEQRTWTGRLVTWGWFAVIVSLYSAVFTDRNFFRGYSEIQRLMAWLLAGSMVMSAAGSFRRERESGVLELLLVSPLGESQIISGRLGGLWGQFLPAFGLLLAIWAYFSHLFRADGDGEAILYYAVTFLALPVIGLYFSLRCRNFISAFLATIVVGLIVPLLLPPLLKFMWSFDTFAPWQMGPSGRAAFFQAILSCICWFALHDRLKRRAFPLERTAI